ncbi:5'-deoxynucleotidase [Velocimicrobium porci]|uniref:5'-deoxynucleotidase n=1 Tax=Velocimicrobium porci TaxID=2606634 RepID=A0A6L5Y1D5_9FIRM|nr:5'-deoxynucleotidase [Velocimicrobium porci]MSS64976.1 5'-deoxynucleotidase [Velocimicrobium porci]
MKSDFFAMMSRMKYIERWALMRNSEKENVSEHSLEVAMIAHALAVISNVRLGNNLNTERAALIGLYHDSTEIITGDMPTPVKYYNNELKTAFKEVEKVAAQKLLSMLPDDMRNYYDSLFFLNPNNEEEIYLWKLEKAADKLSALIKCIEEDKAGNKEFSSAYQALWDSLIDMELEEVNIFIEEFLPSYRKTLDELT